MIHVQIPQFEGPMGLLLYLIRKEEMDIMDINIHDITRQYLDYIRLMKELDLEVAGEFVAMAATLIHIKSKMLLPRYDENGEIVADEDPRKELVQKLLEYQKYQEVSKTLYERPLVGRDVWLRGMKEEIPGVEDQIIIDENGLFALIGMYRSTIRRMNRRVHTVMQKTKSIAARILEISHHLVVGKTIGMRDLIAAVESGRFELLITFLSLLELGKLGFVHLYQPENYGEIYVETKTVVDRDVISRVHEYDAQKAEEIAGRILDESARDDLLITETQIDENGEEIINPEAAPIKAASDEEILAAENELHLNEGDSNTNS